MARDIVLDVLTQAKGRGLLDAANDMDRLADRTDRSSRTFKEFNADVEKARARVRDLSREFATSSGDNSGLLADLKKSRRDLAELERISRTLGKEAGEDFSSGFSTGLQSIPTEAKVALGGAVGVIAAGIAPALGAIVAGAVAGTVGVGGIAGGIAMAAHDGRVRAAAHDFSRNISKEFFSGGDAFVQPTIDALDELERAFRDLHLGDSFAKVAPFVDDFARGIGGLAREFMPGFNRALDAAGPALAALGEELPQLGRSLGTMIGDVAESKGAVDGLKFTFELINSTLELTGKGVAFLSDGFHEMLVAGAAVTGFFEDTGIPVFADMARNANDFDESLAGIGPTMTSAFADIPGRVNNTATQVEHLSAEWDKQADAANNAFAALAKLNDEYAEALNRQLALNNTSIAFEADLDALTRSLQMNGNTLDINSEKGRANATIVNRLIGEAAKLRQEVYDQTGSWDAANRAYDKAVAKIEKIAGQAGITKKELEKMAGNYKITITTTSVFKTIGTPPRLGDAHIGTNVASFAVGTPSAPAGWAWVGERGPELMKLRGGEQIVPTGASMAMAGGGDGGIMGTLVVEHRLDGDVIRTELLTLKRQRGLSTLGF